MNSKNLGQKTVPAIETFDLTKYYGAGRIRALEGCDLRVEPGTIFSLLGPNGAGKTTLIKLLLGIAPPTRGEGRILGENISGWRFHSRIGYLAENQRFPNFLSAERLLHYYGRMAGVRRSALREKIPYLLGTVGLEEWRKAKIRKFSKGMIQRLGLAQALINDPELLFLDEPTEGLDPVGRRQVRDLLLDRRREGKTVFLNSHLLSEVELVSDRIAILKEGRILKQGEVGDFTSVRNTYQLSLEGGRNGIGRICRKLKIPFAEEKAYFRIEVKDELHLNELIDALRAEKMTIKSLVPSRISLEDYFIEIVGEKEANGD